MAFRTEEQIIERIRELREDRGIQKKTVAEALGVDPSAITRLESGQRGLAAAELATIADLLGVSTDELLRDDVAVMVLRADTGDEKVAAAMEVVDSLVSTYRYLDAIAGGPPRS
jgi:transcriptional regulator with XRE-family HTH domain